MATLIKHKRVEFSELFYDLVFVFAISKATALIHPIHNGVLAWIQLATMVLSYLLGCWHINPYLIFSIFGSVF